MERAKASSTARREWFSMPHPVLSRLVSANPARILGEDGERGAVEAGKVADFFLAADDFQIREVFRDGRSIWRA